MSAIVAILSNEAVLNLLIIGVGGALTWILGKIGNGAIKKQQIDRAREITKAAASSLYEEAEQLKKQFGGKLPPEEQEKLTKKAMGIAQNIGIQYGIDIAKLVGPTVFKLFVVEGVKNLKNKVIGKKLPKGILEMLPILLLCFAVGCSSLPNGWETADPNFVLVVSDAFENLDVDLECVTTSCELLASQYMANRIRGLDKDESAQLAIAEVQKYIKTNFKELLNGRTIEEFLKEELNLDEVISDAEIWLGMIIQSLSKDRLKLEDHLRTPNSQ